MKKIVSLVFVLILCGICFCSEIYSTYFGNLDTDDMAKYHVGVLAISTCQDIVKDKDNRVVFTTLGLDSALEWCKKH